MSNNSRRNNLVLQGSILAAASLIVRLIGMLYRIPLVNILTDEGNGYYGVAYDVYSYLLIISSYGFPAAISKIIAAKLSKNKYREAHKIFRASLVLSIMFGALTSSGLYFGAPYIAAFIEVEGAVFALQGLAPALFIFSFMAVIRGYFQGMNTMVPTAISQVIEQIFNAVFSIVLAFLLLERGYGYAAAGSSLGTASGAFFGSVFLVFVYFAMRPVVKKKVFEDPHDTDSGNIIYYWKLLLMTSVPMVIGTSTFHLTNLVDMVMFNKALAYHQYNPTQIATLYGILSGKYKILITLPVSLASAMATASIPSITRSLVLKDYEVVTRKVDLAIRSVMLISIPSMVGLFILARPILELLFTNLGYIEVTTAILQLGSLSVVLFGLSTISIGLLQGLDLLRVPVRNSLISLAVKVVFNIILLYVLNTNLYGAVITNIIFAGCSAFLNLRAVTRRVKLKVDVYKTVIGPMIASLIMAGVAILAFYAANMRFSGDVSTLIVLPAAVLAYGFSILKLRIFDEDELGSIPFGNRLKRFL